MNSEACIVSFDSDGLRLDTQEDAEVICQALQDKQVEILILQGNTFNIEAAERVGAELANQPLLREAHFKDLFTSRGREVVPEAMKHLLQGINNSGARLTLLDLSDNAIGPIGAPSVIEFLESPSCETLETLLLHNCGLGPEGSSSISLTIPRLEKLRKFVCGRNRLEDKGATHMSRALKKLSNLEVLILNQNGIKVDGIKELAGVLTANKKTIKEFDLSDNTIKDVGSEALARAITQMTNLEIIGLDDALLENEGFSIICDGLSKSPSLSKLKRVKFEGNELHGEKIVDLIEITFSGVGKDLSVYLLENEFSPSELMRLEAIEGAEIIVDDIDSDNEDEDEDEDDRKRAYSESDANSEDSTVSNGYVDIGNIESEMREVSQDFIASFRDKPLDSDKVNRAFGEMISTGTRPYEGPTDFQAVQILCEELGLMKLETTRKKKPLEKDAIIYIGKRSTELPPAFKDFFEAVVKNNDDLSCGKILFEKF